MYVCMCLFIDTYVCTQLCNICMYLFIHRPPIEYVFIYVSMYVCKYSICMYVSMYVFMNTVQGVNFATRFDPLSDSEDNLRVVTQVYSSALSCAYSGIDCNSWAALANLVLCATYEVNSHIHTYIHTYIHTHIHTYIHGLEYESLFSVYNVFTYTFVYKFIYIHTVHAYIHTYIQI